MSYPVSVLALMALLGLAFECILRAEERRSRKMDNLLSRLAKAVADGNPGLDALAPDSEVAEKEMDVTDSLSRRHMALRRGLMPADEFSTQEADAWASPLHTNICMDIHADPAAGLDLFTRNASDVDVGIWS